MGPAPPGFTGVELINLDADFGPHNTRWVTPKTRRSLSEMPGNKNRPRIGKLKDPCHVVIVLERKHADYLQNLANLKSVKNQKRATISTVVREYLEENLPAPDTIDMLGKKVSSSSKNKKVI